MRLYLALGFFGLAAAMHSPYFAPLSAQGPRSAAVGVPAGPAVQAHADVRGLGSQDALPVRLAQATANNVAPAAGSPASGPSPSAARVDPIVPPVKRSFPPTPPPRQVTKAAKPPAKTKSNAKSASTTGAGITKAAVKAKGPAKTKAQGPNAAPTPGLAPTAAKSGAQPSQNQPTKK